MSLRTGGMITAQRYDIIDVRTMNYKRTWDNGLQIMRIFVALVETKNDYR